MFYNITPLSFLKYISLHTKLVKANVLPCHHHSVITFPCRDCWWRLKKICAQCILKLWYVKKFTMFEGCQQLSNHKTCKQFHYFGTGIWLCFIVLWWLWSLCLTYTLGYNTFWGTYIIIMTMITKLSPC